MKSQQQVLYRGTGHISTTEEIEKWQHEIQRKEFLLGPKKAFQTKWLLLHSPGDGIEVGGKIVSGTKYVSQIMLGLKYNVVEVDSPSQCKKVRIHYKSPLGNRNCYIYDLDSIGCRESGFPNITGDPRAAICIVCNNPYEAFVRKGLASQESAGRQIFTVKLSETSPHAKAEGGPHHIGEKDKGSFLSPWEALWHIETQRGSGAKDWEDKARLFGIHGKKIRNYWWNNMYSLHHNNKVGRLVPRKTTTKREATNPDALEICAKQTQAFSEVDVSSARFDKSMHTGVSAGHPTLTHKEIELACTLMQLTPHVSPVKQRKDWTWKNLSDPTKDSITTGISIPFHGLHPYSSYMSTHLLRKRTNPMDRYLSLFQTSPNKKSKT